MESKVMDKILGVKPGEVPFRIDEASAIFQYARAMLSALPATPLRLDG